MIPSLFHKPRSVRKLKDPHVPRGEGTAHKLRPSLSPLHYTFCVSASFPCSVPFSVFRSSDLSVPSIFRAFGSASVRLFNSFKLRVIRWGLQGGFGGKVHTHTYWPLAVLRISIISLSQITSIITTLHLNFRYLINMLTSINILLLIILLQAREQIFHH